MQTTKQKNKSLQDASNLFYSESESEKLFQEDELWNSSLNLSKNKKLKFSLVEIKEWILDSETKVAQQSEGGEKVFIELTHSEKEAPFNTRIDFIFQSAFLVSVGDTIKDKAIFKLIPIVLFFLFGSLGTLFQSYLVIACFCIILGVTKDVIKKGFHFSRINKAIFEQIIMILCIGILNVFVNGLIDQKVLGEFSAPLVNALILWFFATNFLSTIKYLTLLGIPLPKTLKSKIEAIKTILD
jgi:phage-related holin